MMFLKDWGELAEGAFGGRLFQRQMAEGKKVLLWISVLEWGICSLAEWPLVVLLLGIHAYTVSTILAMNSVVSSRSLWQP